MKKGRFEHATGLRLPSATLVLLFTTAWCVQHVAAQEPATSQATRAGREPPRVVQVVPSEAGLGLQRTIRVTVDGLPQPATEPEAAALAAEYSQWVLYLNGRPMARLHPMAVDVWRGHFHFELRRNEESADAWRVLFKQFNLWRFSNRIELTVGPPAGGTRVVPLSSDAEAAPFFDLVVVPPRRFWILAAAYVVLLVVVVWLSRRTTMLRAPEPAVVPLRARAFSLGRTQMALWFMIAVASYLFLGLITDDWTGTMNASTLGLMGIAAGTALGAHAIDVRKEALGPTTAALQAQEDTLRSAILAAPQGQAAPALAAQLLTVSIRHADSAAALAARPQHAQSRNILSDLVTDETGVALHRVQVVVWTVLLAGAFVYLVIRDLAMPEFDATLLSLMGISSGTYLGFKWPEKQ